MGVCDCSMFCCALLCVRSDVAVVLMGRRELIALLNLSSSCLVMVERLFLAVPRGCLRFVIVVFPDHTHLLFLIVVCGNTLAAMSFTYKRNISGPSTVPCSTLERTGESDEADPSSTTRCCR